MNKRINLPVVFEMQEENILNDDSLIYSRIKVMHSDENLNGSTFGKDAIDKAENSLKNKPVLAYIRKKDGEDQKDFAGHEMELSFDGGEVSVTYLERPIGIIPETNNYELVEEDGKLWVYTDAYLWSDYMNDAKEIFEENPNKSVSMEIAVDEYNDSEGIIDITAYRYTGVTVLGDDVTPAMTGANIQVMFSSDSEGVDEEFISRIQKLNERIEFAMKKDEEENEEMGCGDKEKEFEEDSEVFELTYKAKHELLSKAVNKAEENWAWLIDFTDEYVIYETESFVDGEWIYSNYKANYSINGEEVEVMGEKEQVFLTWATQEQIDAIEADKVSFAEELRELNQEVENLTTELNDTKMSLMEYKQAEEQAIEAERKLNIDEVISDFERDLNGVEEFEVIKQSPYNFESAEKLEEALLLIYAKNNRKGNTSKKKTKSFSMVSVEINDKPINKESRYGDAEKYFNKSKEE